MLEASYEGFLPKKIFRQGPRVYVAGGTYGGKKAIFKAAFKKGRSLTSKNLKREALFLDNAPSYLSKFLPKLFRHGQAKDGRFWYLVEWVWPGKAQSVGESNFLVKSNFFTQKSLSWALGTLASLRRFSPSIPLALKKELAGREYELSDYRRLLEPQGKRFFGRKSLEVVKGFLDSAESHYNRLNKATITHHEFYGSQILSSGNSFKLTDWENVGWGHPLRDFTTLWIRAFEHPAWQRKFLEEFKKESRVPSQDFEVLFQVEKVLQNFGNLVLFDQTKLKEERRVKQKAVAFFRQCVLDTVSAY